MRLWYHITCTVYFLGTSLYEQIPSLPLQISSAAVKQSTEKPYLNAHLERPALAYVNDAATIRHYEN